MPGNSVPWSLHNPLDACRCLPICSSCSLHIRAAFSRALLPALLPTSNRRPDLGLVPPARLPLARHPPLALEPRLPACLALRAPQPLAAPACLAPARQRQPSALPRLASQLQRRQQERWCLRSRCRLRALPPAPMACSRSHPRWGGAAGYLEAAWQKRAACRLATCRCSPTWHGLMGHPPSPPRAVPTIPPPPAPCTGVPRSRVQGGPHTAACRPAVWRPAPPCCAHHPSLHHSSLGSAHATAAQHERHTHEQEPSRLSGSGSQCGGHTWQRGARSRCAVGVLCEGASRRQPGQFMRQQQPCSVLLLHAARQHSVPLLPAACLTPGYCPTPPLSRRPRQRHAQRQHLCASGEPSPPVCARPAALNRGSWHRERQPGRRPGRHSRPPTAAHARQRIGPAHHAWPPRRRRRGGGGRCQRQRRLRAGG